MVFIYAEIIFSNIAKKLDIINPLPVKSSEVKVVKKYICGLFHKIMD